jgi:putative phage-type endonuclease
MKIVNLQQRTPDWHKWRASGVSASEAIIVLGQDPLKTRYRLYTEKKGITLPDNLDANPFVQRGIRLEATARRSFEQRHDTLLLPLCAESDKYPFMRASYDGVSDEGISVELKVPMEVNFREAQKEGVRSKVYRRYYYQVQQQIMVADNDRGYLSLYLNDKEPPVDFLIQRNDVVINQLISDAQCFVDCLVNNTPPTTDLGRDIYIPDGQKLDQWNTLASNYHRAEEMIEALNLQLAPFVKEQTDIEEQFIKLMGQYVQAESAGLRVNRYLQQGSIDYKAALLALKPDIDASFLEKFRKPSSERTRFTLKGEEKAVVPFSMDDLMSAQEGDFWF